MQRIVVFAIVLLSCVYAQNVGGMSGTCSAQAIPPPYDKPITLYGSNVGAVSYSNCVSSSAGVVWFTISPPPSVNISLTTCNTGTNFDTVISVYTTNTTCQFLQCATFNDDASCTVGNSSYSGRSTLNFHSTGVTYYIGIGGYSSSSGNFQLTLSQINSSSSGNNNPGCSNATVLYGPYNPVTVFGYNNGITGVTDLVNTTCQINIYQFSTWYQIFPTVGQYVNVTTCNPGTNFDTILTVAAGSSCSSLNCTARNDDSCYYFNSTSSSIDFYASASSYYIIVSGYSSFQGNYELSIFQSSSGSGNGTGGGNSTSGLACTSARSVSYGGTYLGSTNGTNPNSFVDACSRYSGRPAVWFYLPTPFTNSSVTVSTCNSITNFDTVLLIYSGSCSSLTCIAYNDDASCSDGPTTTSTVTFYPSSGNTGYYIVVAAYSSTTSNGSFQLEIY